MFFKKTVLKKKQRMQLSQYVNVLSQDNDQEIRTDTSVPFLDIVYNESELDSSYKSKQSVTETERSSSSSSNVIGYIWTMTLSELNTTSFGKKEMTTTNKKVKSVFDDAYEDAMKPGDMDKRLLLSALFDCPKSTEPIARLPEKT